MKTRGEGYHDRRRRVLDRSRYGGALRERGREGHRCAPRHEGLHMQKAATAAGPGNVASACRRPRRGGGCAMVARAMEGFGHVDVLCNNAAAPGTDRYIWEQTLENWNGFSCYRCDCSDAVHSWSSSSNRCWTDGRV